MLLAHTVVGLIQPVFWGPVPLLLTPSAPSFLPLSGLPRPVEEVPLPPYCFLPHGPGSREGGRGGGKLEEVATAAAEPLLLSTTDEEQLLCSTLLLVVLLGTMVRAFLFSGVSFGSSSASSVKSFRRREQKAESGRRGGKKAPRAERSILLSLLLPTCWSAK